MEVVIAFLIVSMGAVFLEFATDGAWRSGHWHPRVPAVPAPVWLHRPIGLHRSRHCRRQARIVYPHVPPC